MRLKHTHTHSTARETLRCNVKRASKLARAGRSSSSSSSSRQRHGSAKSAGSTQPEPGLATSAIETISRKGDEENQTTRISPQRQRLPALVDMLLPVRSSSSLRCAFTYNISRIMFHAQHFTHNVSRITFACEFHATYPMATRNQTRSAN